ncbi:hypothetical protein [Niallia sp. Krafla_26]|uniref:hypothetical protein n=1 Tax=Niallia sp. Krafla_26 TaxID=3064703 RepID=UPI003D17454B
MKLPNGVTGFYDSDANSPPRVDGKQFKHLCFDFASRNCGKVLDFMAPQYPSNFYQAKVEILSSRFHILLNEHYPYLAFASVLKFRKIKFIDRPPLNERFSSFYKIMGKAELNAPFKQRHIKDAKLNRAELEQIAYWLPETIGQIIFNYWD